jgi:hypothetical protein
MLAKHFAFVRRLLHERKITCKVARKLFGLSPVPMTLRVFDLDNGTFHLPIAPPPGFEERRAAQALALREFAAAPRQSWTRLWKRLRLDFHYPLDFPAFASLLHRYVVARRRRPPGGARALPRQAA